MDIGDRTVSAEAVSAELEVALIAPDDVVVPLDASLYYTSRDPYAVRVAFHVGADRPNEWTFARDLLAQGLMTCAGVGDVQLWPSDDATVTLQLCAPQGSARFHAPAEGIAAFLTATYNLVELGQEAREIDIEAELALLREA